MLGIRSPLEGTDWQVQGSVNVLHSCCLCLRDDDVQEAQESYYNMSEESYEVVSRFVQFCYLLRYDTVGPTTTKHFADRQLKDETGVISSLEAGKGRIMIIRWPKRRLDHFSSGAFFQGGQLQAAHEDSLPSAEKLAHELNGRRFCLDIAMWRLADMYHVQPLKSHAFEQLRQRLYVYLSGNGTPAPFLYAIAPIYACTGNGDLVLRPLILRVLEACKAEILHDPLLSSRLSQIAADVDEFSQDHGRIFHAPIPSIWDGMPIPPMPQI